MARATDQGNRPPGHPWPPTLNPGAASAPPNRRKMEGGHPGAHDTLHTDGSKVGGERQKTPHRSNGLILRLCRGSRPEAGLASIALTRPSTIETMRHVSR